MAMRVISHRFFVFRITVSKLPNLKHKNPSFALPFTKCNIGGGKGYFSRVFPHRINATAALLQ